MLSFRQKLRNVSTVQASTTVVITIPVGPRYQYIELQHGYAAGTNTIAGAMANISEIRLLKDTKVQQKFSGTQLRDLLLLNGTQYDCLGLPNTAPGVSIPLYLMEPWRDNDADKIATAWATKYWSSFTIEVDLGTASTPTLAAFAVFDNFDPGQTAGTTGQVIRKIYRENINASGTSFDYSPADRRDYLSSITLYPDSGGSNAATEVDLRINGSIISELTSSANEQLLANFGMAPAATGRSSNLFDMVIDYDGLLSRAIDLSSASSMTLTVQAAAAMSGTITAMIERYGQPD